MVESNKGHNLVNISQNLLKTLSGHLNTDPKSYAKHQNPCSRGFQDVVLTRFLDCNNGRVQKGA